MLDYSKCTTEWAIPPAKGEATTGLVACDVRKSPLLLLAILAAACTAPPAPSQAHPAPRTGPPAPTPDVHSPSPTDAPEAPKPLPEAAGLHYVEIVTGGAASDAELPMLVAIHGLGDDPRNFQMLVADLPVEARVILPRGLDEHGDGWSWFPIRARDPDVEALAEGIDLASDAIARGVAELVETRPTVGKPVVTGFSQGGMLTMNLAVRHGEQFSSAVAVGGWLPPPTWPERESVPPHVPPILALHGDTDAAVKIGPTREAIEHLQGLGLEVELHEYPGIGHAIPPEMRGELHERLGAELEAAAAAR